MQNRLPQQEYQQYGNPRRSSPSGIQQRHTDSRNGPSPRSGPSPVVSSTTGSGSGPDASGTARQNPGEPRPQDRLAENLRYSVDRYRAERQREEEPWKPVGTFRYEPVREPRQDGERRGRR